MEQKITIQSTINYIKKELKGLYSTREAENIAYILTEFVLQRSTTQIRLSKNEEIKPELFQQIELFVTELKSNKPVQYVLGETEFYGLTFKVNEYTLIPRPETEELVHTIISENHEENLNILDVGTGSGCIPVSLSKNMKQAQVSSTDISLNAIEKAKENALLNQVTIDFYHRDILKWQTFKWKQFDIIVSNPPYVTESEKDLMEKNVLDYEPHTALFVSDTDPLIFYRTIVEFSMMYLKPNGKLYFEINESLGQEMLGLLTKNKFQNIRLLKDINGKERMISAIKMSQ